MSGPMQSSEQGFWLWDRHSLAACVALYSSFVLFPAEYFTALSLEGKFNSQEFYKQFKKC